MPIKQSLFALKNIVTSFPRKPGNGWEPKTGVETLAKPRFGYLVTWVAAAELADELRIDFFC